MEMQPRHLSAPCLFAALWVFSACGEAASGEHQSGRGAEARSEREVPTDGPSFAPGGEAGCPDGDGLTILLDGPECVDPAYEAGKGQPAAAVRLTEPDGSVSLLLIDIGNAPEAFENNLSRWVEGLGPAAPGPDSASRTAILFSHIHTYAPLMAPPWKFIWQASAESLTQALGVFGDLPIHGPNLDDICRDMERTVLNSVARDLCINRARAPKPGLAPIGLSDGTASSRAWVLTYPMDPQERDRILFQPFESIFIFRVGDGYVVYSVCSHLHSRTPGSHDTRPFHAVERVQDLIDDGSLPAGPIHTLITGVCGMVQSLHRMGRADSQPSPEDLRVRLNTRVSELLTRVKLRHLYLSHCGLEFVELWPTFQELFGDEVELAVPGTCIPL